MEENKRAACGRSDVSLSPSLSSSFSIFPYLLLSTGGGGGRPNSPRGGLWTLQSLYIPVIYFNWRGGKKKRERERNVLINHLGSHGFHVPPSYGDRGGREKMKEKWKKNPKQSVSAARLLFDVRPIRQTAPSWNKQKQVAAAALGGLHSGSTPSKTRLPLQAVMSSAWPENMSSDSFQRRSLIFVSHSTFFMCL